MNRLFAFAQFVGWVVIFLFVARAFGLVELDVYIGTPQPDERESAPVVLTV